MKNEEFEKQNKDHQTLEPKKDYERFEPKKDLEKFDPINDVKEKNTEPIGFPIKSDQPLRFDTSATASRDKTSFSQKKVVELFEKLPKLEVRVHPIPLKPLKEIRPPGFPALDYWGDPDVGRHYQ